jgi:hypothetical protein
MDEWPKVEISRIWEQGNRHEVVNARFGKGEWRVSDLREVVKDEPVFDLPLYCIDLGGMDFVVEGGLLGFARHMKHVQDANLDYPIILDEWGGPIDGRHRIVKALVEGRTTIKAVRIPAGTQTTGRSA